MKKNLWIMLALLLVLPGLLFTTSCAKKAIQGEGAAAVGPQQDDDAAKKAEAERQRRLEEERLQSERQKAEAERQRIAAERNSFINDDVYFEFDSAALTPMAQERLKAKAKWMNDNPGVQITIEGHCDERGTNEYNIALGDRRAESAKAFLIDLGISSARMQTVSYGEERPVDPGHNEEAWAKNRRAHFVIK